MKKISIIVMSFVLLYSNWSAAQALRTPLLEEFTQASCVNCPRANDYINPLLSTYPLGQVTAIKYQVNFPGVDTLNLQDPADAATRIAYYPSFNGVPVAAFDGDTGLLSTAISPNDYNGDPTTLTASMLTTEMALTTPLTMTATFSYNAVTDSVTSVVTVTNVSVLPVTASSAGKLKLLFSLEEMNIHFSPDDHPGDNGEADFYYINRKMYPNASGTTLPDAIAAGASVVTTFKFKVPSYIYNKLQMGVAAFVQDFGIAQANRSVLQSVFATSSNVTDAIMTDNTTYPTGGAVCNVTFTPSLSLTNNGTTTLTSATVGYYFNSNTAVTQNWTGSLAAGQSTTVSLPTVTAPDNTFSNISYFINNYNSGAIIDVNDANNTPSSTGIIVSLPAVATMDSLVENFDEGSDQYVGYLFTGQSLTVNNTLGYVADLSFLTNYIWQSVSGTDPIGGYGLSDASYYYNLAETNPGDIGGLVFDKVDLTGYGSVNMTFDHAYARLNANATDALNVLVSTDCGNTWTTAWTASGAALKTAPDNGSVAYSPAANQWVTDTVNMSAYSNMNNIIVQFQAVANGGNGLYVDNINYHKGLALGVQNITNLTSSSVYPNPANGTVSLSLELASTDNFDITLVNTLGQTVKNISNGQLTAGSHTMEVNISDLAAGVYNFSIKSGNNTIAKRFVVTN
jgi:hypothetical protein